MTAKVLVTEDDASLRDVLQLALQEAGYQVQTAANGLEGLRRMYRWQPDLVILDVMMPQMDGWEACQRIREISDVPVLMLTAKTGEANELKGLREGADHYMTKPFLVSVLVARVEALLRRSRLHQGNSKPTVVTVGDLKIDLARHEVTLANRRIDLTPIEFRLLAALAAKPGQVIPHPELLTQIWGPDYSGESLYLKLYIRYLRQKIEKDPGNPRYILTRRGVGYCLDDGSDAGRPSAGPDGPAAPAGTIAQGPIPAPGDG